MVHVITPKVHVPRGDAKKLPFSAVDDDGDAFPLDGCDIEWRLELNDETVLDLDDDGVSISERNNSEGTFEVYIETGVTSDFRPRVHEEYVVITDENGDQSTGIGSFELI